MARTGPDLTACQALRHLCFFGTAGQDVDHFDAICQHIMVFDHPTGGLVGTCRLLRLDDPGTIGQSYAGQFYDLTRLSTYTGPIAEMGRFCIHPDASNTDVLRIAWGALTRFVDQNDIRFLFGCPSFSGTDPQVHRDAFDLLGQRHLAPVQWRPRVKSLQAVPFTDVTIGETDFLCGIRRMPTLLKTYLGMGGWVSDHAVIDTHMQTLHVFTGLEVAKIPSHRVRALRAVAQNDNDPAI